jgi:hypothetical protein
MLGLFFSGDYIFFVGESCAEVSSSVEIESMMNLCRIK